MSDSRPVPTDWFVSGVDDFTREHAEGMLEGILAQRRMEGHTQPGPYHLLDLDDPVDRRIIASVYASMVRAAMGRSA